MLYIFLCLLPLCLSHTYPPEVYTILYGDLSFDDLFLPETVDGNLTEEEMKILDNFDVVEMLRKSYLAENLRDSPEDISNITADGLDATEYNDISSKLYNFTRKRMYSPYKGKTDWDDWNGWEFLKATKFEEKKIKMIRKLCLTLLYHARYKIESVFRQREPIRNDKRYKIGYLFNRLRRIKTEMLKIVSVAIQQNDIWWHRNMTSLLRLYERLVYYDIDIRDTTALLTHTYNTEAAIDFEDPSVTNAGGQYKVTPKMAPPPDGRPPPPGQSGQSLGDDYGADLAELAGYG